MDKQRGIAHIILLLLVLAAAVALLIYFVLPKLGLNLPSVPGTSQASKVSIKSEYKNPFDKKTQYVNPFDQYKSPLVNLKK